MSKAKPAAAAADDRVMNFGREAAVTKMTVGKAHVLLIAMKSLDSLPDVKLSGETRLALAINMNRIEPDVAAYERVRSKTLLDIIGVNDEGEPNPISQAADLKFQQENGKLQDAVVRPELRKIKVADLDISNNLKITASHISGLAPMLEDLDGPAPATAG